MEEVVSWYSDTLGLERIEKPEGTRSKGGWFSAGGQEVHVSVDPHNPPQSAHFGLVVDRASDVVDSPARRRLSHRTGINDSRPSPFLHA